MLDLEEDHDKKNTYVVDNAEFNQMLSSQLSKNKDDRHAFMRIDSLKNVRKRT